MLLKYNAPPCFCCIIISPNHPTQIAGCSPIWYHGMLPWPYEATSCPKDGASEAMVKSRWSEEDGKGKKGRRRAELGERGFPPGEGFPQGSRERCSTGVVARGCEADTRMVRPHLMDAGRCGAAFEADSAFPRPCGRRGRTGCSPERREVVPEVVTPQEVGGVGDGGRWCHGDVD